MGAPCHPAQGTPGDGWSPRAEGAGHGVPGVPTLPRDQGSEAGQELPLCGCMVQPAAHGQGTLAVGSGPSPYTPTLSPAEGWQPRWSAAFLRGQKGWAPAAPAGARATARERRHHGRPGALGWRVGDTVPPTGRGSARGLGVDPRSHQGWAVSKRRAGGPPSSATSLLLGSGASQCPVWGSPLRQERGVGYRHAIRLWADLEAPWALWMTAGHFSRRSSLLFSKKPSLRGTPWEPSGKVRRPGEGRAGSDGAGSSIHRGWGWRDGAGAAGQGHAELVPCRAAAATQFHQALTKTIHAPAFELALKGHVVAAGEDADAVELALHKLALVPAREELLRQQLPAASGDAQGGVHVGAMLTWSRQRR